MKLQASRGRQDKLQCHHHCDLVIPVEQGFSPLKQYRLYYCVLSFIANILVPRSLFLIRHTQYGFCSRHIPGPHHPELMSPVKRETGNYSPEKWKRTKQLFLLI